jgi:hypothetical protein
MAFYMVFVGGSDVRGLTGKCYSKTKAFESKAYILYASSSFLFGRINGMVTIFIGVKQK